jgi:hypothetical protein
MNEFVSNLWLDRHPVPTSRQRRTRTRGFREVVAVVWLLVLPATACNREPAGSTPTPQAPSVAAAPQAPPPQAKAALYKCPMHPEITSDKPGKCSVCGMNLEK